MTYKIVLDNNFSAYSVDLEYSFEPLVQRKTDGRTRGFTTISNQDPEAARHFGFQPGQSNPSLEWTMYDNGEDKSNGSLESSSISDNRLAVAKKDEDDSTGDIKGGADATNDVFTVHGDVTNELSSSDTFEVFGNLGNNGTYTVSTISYDSANDETDITVAEDVTDSSTGGWIQKAVTTTFHQTVWITEYIHDNTSDPRWLLFGGRFSDRNGDRTDEGTNVSVKDTRHREIAGLNAVRASIDLKLGVTI